MVTQPLRAEPSRAAGVLSGEDYPELRLQAVQAAQPVETPSESGETLAEVLRRESPPDLCLALLNQALRQGELVAFQEAVQQLLSALSDLETRRVMWALEILRLLVRDSENYSFPGRTLSIFLEAIGSGLTRKSEAVIRERQLACGALLLGALGVSGELEEVRRLLARFVHEAGPEGSELRKQLLASKELCTAPLHLFFREGHGVLRSHLLPFFRLIGAEGARGLIRRLEEENRQHRGRIMELLKALGPVSCEAVKASLDAEAWYLVRNALNLLGELGDAEAFEATSRFLEHPDVRIRQAAVRAFWKTGGIRAESYLLDLLPRSDPETQAEVLVGLTQIHAPSAVDAVAALASRSGEALRIKCLEALGLLGRPEAIPILAKALERTGLILKTQESLAIRSTAARALRVLGGPEAIAVLEKAIREAPRNGDQNALRKILEQPTWNGGSGGWE